MQRQGQRVAALDSKPELPAYLESYFEAFQTLSTCRALGTAGYGPVPWLAVHSYAQTYGMDLEEMETLWLYVQAMDAEFLRVMANKIKQGGK